MGIWDRHRSFDRDKRKNRTLRVWRLHRFTNDVLDPRVQLISGIRAVASLASTSYLEDSICNGAPPVSVLHFHGTTDDVIRFDGDEIEAGPKGYGDNFIDALLNWLLLQN